MPYFQVYALGQDALEVLCLVRSMRDSFAPVNRTPPEVLSLIPNYLEGYGKDKSLIRLTHVCHDFREIFISRPSLWTYMNFTNTEKTRVYIERSKCAPLEIHLEPPYLEGAFLLAIPHIHRLKILRVSGVSTGILPVLVKHFSCPLPLLDELEIDFPYDDDPTLPHGLFNGDSSSLHKLTLKRVITALPWRNLSNLTTFKLHDVPEDKIPLTQLLDLFESAPYLRHIELRDSLPSSSNAPTERVVSLPHLKDLSIDADQPHSILLNHLSIPAGASLRLEFKFDDEDSPISSHLPESPSSLPNLSRITAVNLCFGFRRRYIRLHGPSGELSILWNRIHMEERPSAGTSRVMQYLGQLDISRTRWLVITLCRYWIYVPARITHSTLYRTLHRMEDLRTLMLIRCENLPFIRTLNPDNNPSKVALCPRLEEIIFYIGCRDLLHVDELINMAEERASRGAKLSAIKIFNTDLAEEVLYPLREHVSHVEHESYDKPPDWDTIPN